MELLLAVIILATAAASAESDCEDNPLVVNVYNKAKKIGIDTKSFGGLTGIWFDDISIEGLINTIVDFMKIYEKLGPKYNCKDLLCQEQTELIRYIDEEPEEWAKIPQKMRLDLENYLDHMGRAILKLTPEYCKELSLKLTEIAMKLKPLSQLHFKKTDVTTEFFQSKANYFIRTFEAVDKKNCARLDFLIHKIYFVKEWSIKEYKDFQEFLKPIDKHLSGLLGAPYCERPWILYY